MGNHISFLVRFIIKEWCHTFVRRQAVVLIDWLRLGYVSDSKTEAMDDESDMGGTWFEL